MAGGTPPPTEDLPSSATTVDGSAAPSEGNLANLGNLRRTVSWSDLTGGTLAEVKEYVPTKEEWDDRPYKNPYSVDLSDPTTTAGCQCAMM